MPVALGKRSADSVVSSVRAQRVGGLGLVGAELINGIGEADGSMVLSNEQLLIDHDTAAMALRMSQGIEISPETLAADLICKVGVGGSYLAQMHTIRHMREILLPMLRGTNPYEEWVKRGKKDPMVAAGEKAEEIPRATGPFRSIAGPRSSSRRFPRSQSVASRRATGPRSRRGQGVCLDAASPT